LSSRYRDWLFDNSFWLLKFITKVPEVIVRSSLRALLKIVKIVTKIITFVVFVIFVVVGRPPPRSGVYRSAERG
jgi:hypothetical protein